MWKRGTCPVINAIVNGGSYVTVLFGEEAAPSLANCGASAERASWGLLRALTTPLDHEFVSLYAAWMP